MKNCDVCQRLALVRGLCRQHYDEARRSGRIEMSQLKRRSVKERLGQYSKLDHESGCIEWFGDAYSSGYGKIWANGRTELAHRVAWAVESGPIPDGMQVLHKCDNPSCINPAHLFLGTQADNVADCSAKGRRANLKGREISSAKLTEGDVRKIRLDCRAQDKIAADYGVSRATISLVQRRELWRHVA